MGSTNRTIINIADMMYVNLFATTPHKTFEYANGETERDEVRNDVNIATATGRCTFL